MVLVGCSGVFTMPSHCKCFVQHTHHISLTCRPAGGGGGVWASASKGFYKLISDSCTLSLLFSSPSMHSCFLPQVAAGGAGSVEQA